ncbi:MAG TPA: peptidoglycan DD-metalloendopeptidase family protein [Candidatus Dormibacteraeota bacterium]|nr:peptidoglycan DD-metalloendopeptidase family protein [Candidatus Dormibacteraeota bacterium]
MTLGVQDLVALAQAAGTGGDPQVAAAIALAESGGDPTAVGVNSDQWRSRDRGLWQINDHWHPEVSDACAFDPGCSARAAYAISNGWTDFSAWATFQSGAYQRFMPSTATAEQQPPAGRSLYGQSVVGQMVTTPWFPGSWEVTQGWGPTDYDGEPEGHGYQHWHAGADVGVDCGTTITLPAGLSGTARALDNPGGYGTALIVLLNGYPVGVLLGHLRQRLVDDRQQVQGGTPLAISNSTGNSTGCHVHFEVRPQDSKQPLGIARYGNDIDPSQWLTSGQAGTSAELLSATQDQGLGAAIQRGAQTILAGAEVLMGAGLVIAGLIATAYGMRGQSAEQLGRDVRRRTRALARPRPERRREPEPDTTPAGETRIRPDLQRRPGPDIVSSRTGSARLDPRTGLPRGPRTAARPRPVLRARSTSGERARERRLDEDLAARMRARRSRSR